MELARPPLPSPAAARLAGWSRRFMAATHADPALHRAGLLLGAQDEVRFWPFPPQPSLEALAGFLEVEAAKAQELDPEAVALVLPVAPGHSGLELAPAAEHDYDLMLVAVDAARHCATMASPVSGGLAQGWRDLPGYVPTLAPLLFAAFRDVQTPRPDDPWEWGLVEAAAHDDPAALVAASLAEQAFRRGSTPKRMRESLLDARPHGEAWAAIVAEAQALAHRYHGYHPEIDGDDPAGLATLDDQRLGALSLGGLIALVERGQDPPADPDDWPDLRQRLARLSRPA